MRQLSSSSSLMNLVFIFPRHRHALVRFTAMLMPRVSSHVREQWLSIKSLCAHFVFVELANAAERSQAKEDVLRDQDTPAQFGPPKESLRQQIHRRIWGGLLSDSPFS